MKQYFIHDGQNEKGPLTIEQLKAESLKNETPIWHEGLANWTTVGEIVELKELLNLKSVPPKMTFAKPLENPVLTTKKKSLTSLIIGGVFVVVAIIGWLVYQNKSQAETLNSVQEKVSQQQQEQQQKDQQQTLEAQQQQEEKDKVNAELTEKYMGYRNNWRGYITSSSNQYTYSELGGISDLATIITNKTDKNIDEVQVRVDYIKDNGGTYKSETVSITNIGPNSKKSVYAPTSD